VSGKSFQINKEKNNKSLTDTLVITKINKDLYICTCKPNTASPNGEGKIYYQGKFKKDAVTEDADYHNCDERFLMQWDLSGLPKGIKIIEAKMQLVCVDYNGDKQGQLVYECISEPWNENIGYSKKPNTLSQTRVLADWPAKNANHVVDITTFVKAWYNGNITNYGLMGFSVNTETTNSAIFCSSRFPEIDLRPKLIIIYSKE
jgi:hypothetical protein